ncbi:CoB--CoM heterodisulfide reductase iron-sulfur subunit B family protein [Elusimicrobiota bacterium]
MTKKISYMPGCTLKTNARNLETTALEFLNIFGIEAVELEDWFCCGTTFSLASDNLMYQLAPVRILVKAKQSGNKKLLTLCSMCYNTIKRAQELIINDKEKRDKINDFMYKEDVEFNGDEVEVVHLLQLIKEDIGFKAVGKKIKNKTDIKVAPYYGCLLLRPESVSIDSTEDPQIMEELFTAMGCEPVYFPLRTECCGSYHIVDNEEVIMEKTYEIVSNAVNNGADVIVTSCPLCSYNLDSTQEEVKKKYEEFKPLPVLYITQLMMLLLGGSIGDTSLHSIDPTRLLKEKALL